MALTPLPIDPHLPRVLGALEKSSNLILMAQPGTGKTTRVPSALLDAHFCAGKEVWVLEPRRLAAKLAARRVAAERGEDIGQTVGYQFRFENVQSAKTRLRFLTEGMVIRHLISDPRLSKVGAVVLDEFHERHLHGDIALAVLRNLQNTTRPDLRLVVMSATLRPEPIQAFLSGCTVIDVPAPHHPLTVRYSPSTDTPLEQMVLRAVRDTLNATDYPGGDFLVFLPGMGEIRRAETALAVFARERGLAVHALHGELSKEEQDLAIARGPKTKVILSTNVAESSLTIEGVNTVIDSGLHRSASETSWSGMPSLKVKPVSKASAIQRAGRAARTGRGLCVRLYALGDFEHRVPHETPEIQRSELSRTVLELKSLGVVDEQVFGWFERPAESALQTARTLLYRLGALQSDGPAARLTEAGKAMVRIPIHPRLARLLQEAQKRGCSSDAVRLAAQISEGALSGVDALESARRGGAPERVVRQLQTYFPPQSGKPSPEALAQSALAAFPDRVGRLRGGKGTEMVLSSGGSVRTEDLSGFRSEYFLVLDARETPGHGGARGAVRATSVVAIEPEWLLELEPSAISDEKVLEWDKARQCLTAKTRSKYGALVLEESGRPLEPSSETGDALLHLGLGIRADTAASFTVHQWVEALVPVASKEILENAFAKQALAREHARGKDLPTIYELVLRGIVGAMSFEHLKALDWASVLVPQDVFGRSLPSEIALPGGRKVRVNYALGRAPWIESRMQDFFGLKQGPTLLDGKVVLTIHLLAPNYRAVQVTTDLAGFWKNHYPALRRELSRNYPRHFWPEDPVNSKPPPPKPRRA